MKKNLVALREEGLPLDEIETKMLSMSEELMRRMLPMVDIPVTNDHLTMETNRRENDKMENVTPRKFVQAFRSLINPLGNLINFNWASSFNLIHMCIYIYIYFLSLI